MGMVHFPLLPSILGEVLLLYPILVLIYSHYLRGIFQLSFECLRGRRAV